MAWTFYRYMLADLMRIMLLAAGVLVTVIAFGATVKPLAAGMLAPTDIAKYVGLAIVPMLQFALPFAAGFASTLVFHRMVNDNEVLAVTASGLSHGRILLPVIVSGVVLALIMLLLVHFVIPRFWVMMRATLERDIARMFESAVASGEAFELGNDLQLVAEELRVVQQPEGTDATRRLYLGGVAAAQLDDQGAVVKDITARIAAIDFYEVDGRTYLNLAMEQAYLFDRSKDEMQFAFFPRFEPTDPIPLPDETRDDPKAMSLPQLLAIRANPDQYHQVLERRQTLARAIEVNRMWDEIATRIATNGAVSFHDVSSDRRYTIQAQRMRAQTLSMAGAQTVEIQVHRGERHTRTLSAQRVDLDLLESDDAMFFNLIASDVSVYDVEADETLFEDSSYRIPTVRLVREPTLKTLRRLDSSKLSALAREITDDRRVQTALENLQDKIYDVQCETAGRLAQRTAMGVTACLLLILGSVLALHLRDAMPLTIYLLAFLPSILDILLISGGEQMMRDQRVLGGFIVMWSGNILLLVIILLTYVRISRN